ncbi:MAG: hypothetical protein R6U46_09160 [Marinilabilia sp.]
MASIRNLKKEINHMTSEIVTEAYVRKMLFGSVSEEDFKNIITNALNLRNELIARVNNPDGKDDPKLVKSYFQAVRNDMRNKFSELVEAVNELK